MKKLLLLAVAIFGFAATSSAQSFTTGTNNLTLTAGFGGGYGVPIALSYERGVVDFAADHKLGAGAYVGFGSSNLFVAAECNYHFVGVSKLDLYAGVRLGVLAYSGSSAFATSFDIGANYFFNDSWAINAEVGSGLGALNLGITHRF